MSTIFVYIQSLIPTIFAYKQKEKVPKNTYCADNYRL